MLAPAPEATWATRLPAQAKALDALMNGASMLALTGAAAGAAWRCRCYSWPDDHDPLDPAEPWPSPEEEE